MRRLDATPLIAALGGLVLFVSLFLHWYQPGLSAWTAFEVLDLVLAALGLGAIAVAGMSLRSGEPPPERVLAAIGGVAFVIVVSQVINHPPAAEGGTPQFGAWLGLAGSALMAIAGILQVTRVSVDVSLPVAPERDGARQARPQATRPRAASPANEAAAVEPEVHDELYPEHHRHGPIGADDPELLRAASEDKTVSLEPDREESG